MPGWNNNSYCLLAVILLLGFHVSRAFSDELERLTSRQAGNEIFVSTQTIVELELRIDGTGLDSLRKTRRQYVRGSINTNGFVIDDVAIKLKEGFDKTFLRRHFAEAGGNLYDGGWHSDVHEPLEKDSGDGPDDHSDLDAWRHAALEPDLEGRLESLNKILDLDRFLAFMAMEVMIWHWDGYTMHHNNYRLYHDPAVKKFVFLPHGMDQLFFMPEGPTVPSQQGIIAKAVLEIPAARERYLQEFRRLFREHYDVESLTGRIEELDRRMRPIVAKTSPRELVRYDDAVRTLKSKVKQRAENLEKQIR